jgi:hypothetical protein
MSASTEIGSCRTTKFAVLEFKSNIAALEVRTQAAVAPPATEAPLAKPSATAKLSTAQTQMEKTVIENLNVESLILTTLARENVIPDTWDLALQYSLDHQVVVGHMKSLLVDLYIKEEAKSTTLWIMTEEGESILKCGSPEYQVFAAVPAGGVAMEVLNQSLGEAVVKIGLGPCMKNKWVKKDKNLIVRLAESIRDETAELLHQLAAGIELTEDDLKNLKKRKLVNQQIRKSYRIEKGEEYSERRQKRCADITREMLGDPAEVRSASRRLTDLLQMEQGMHWSERKFKPMNFSAMGAPITGGSLHPLLKVYSVFLCLLRPPSPLFPLSRSERSSVASSWRWASKKCQPTNGSRAPFGISMLYSSLRVIQLAMLTTPST